MTQIDWMVFWTAVILIMILSLVSTSELVRIIKFAYRELVQGLKWQPYLGYITGSKPQRKRHQAIGANEENGGSQRKRWKIFPKARRTT